MHRLRPGIRGHPHPALPRAAGLLPRLRAARLLPLPAGEELPGDPIARAQRELAAGRIVAVKGVGGFHLACDARSEAAVRRLRARKHRPEKPLAVLCADAEEARAFCRVGEAERALLESPRRPIVLLDKLDPAAFPALSANDRLGVMLPGTPLHVLLTDGTAGGPRSVVCTSANVPGCPVILENGEALRALANVADCFLVHNREIVNRCDDSLVLPWRGGGRLSAAQPRLRAAARGAALFRGGRVGLRRGAEGVVRAGAAAAALS